MRETVFNQLLQPSQPVLRLPRRLQDRLKRLERYRDNFELQVRLHGSGTASDDPTRCIKIAPFPRLFVTPLYSW